MLQNEYLKQWQFDVIKNLTESGLAVPVLLIYNDGKLSPLDTKETSKPCLLWRFYEKKFLRRGPLQNVLINESLKNLEKIHCKVIQKGRFSEYFQDEDIKTIRSFEPDFMLRFGFSIIRGDILHAAPYGVWSYHHSDEQLIRGGPAGFWEVFLKHHVQGVILQRLTNHLDGGIVLKKRFYKTTMHDCAYHLHQVIRSSTDMPVEVCADILANRAEYFSDKPVSSNAPIYSWPGNLKMTGFFITQFFRRIGFHLKDIFLQEKWAIGIVQADYSSIAEQGKMPENSVLFQYKERHRYPADPFVVSTEKGLRIFFEHYSYHQGKACLSSIILQENGTFTAEKQISHHSTHKSFPFVFEYDGTTYVMPEQIETGKVDLYSWDESNETLTFQNTILDRPLADPVLLLHQNTWFLFGSESGVHVNNTLSLFYSDNPENKFVNHPLKYITFDPRGARMAGSFFTFNGKLYRPGQDSHIYYGKRIAVFEVLELTKVTYKEQFVYYIEPCNNSHLRNGIHTMQISPPYVIFDGKKYVFSIQGFLLKIKQRFSKKNSNV